MKDYKNEYPLNTFSGETKKELEKLLDQVRKETAEAVAEKMIGEISDLRKEDTGDAGETMWNNGYDRRIKEEKEIKKQIIESL